MSDLHTPTIEQTVTTGTTPGSGNGAVAGRPGHTVTIIAQALTEYVAGSRETWYENWVRSLPGAIDDLTRELGDEAYERMMKDSQVESCVNALKAAILASGVRTEPTEVEYDRQAVALGKGEIPAQAQLAKAIADFCQVVLDNLTTPLDDVLWDMLDGMMYGNKVAELIYALEDVGQGLRLVTKAIKVKPREAVAFVVDAFLNVVGLLGLVPGQANTVQVGTMLTDLDQVPNLLPLEKFAVFTFRPRNGDPRGSSIGRSAYTPWWLKQQLWGEYLKYLAQFGSPSLIGFTSADDDAGEEYEEDGETLKPSPEQVMLVALQKMRNGSAAAFKHDSKVQVVEMDGQGGQAFDRAFDRCDRQIAKGILNQTLATEEGQHQARAASETHLGVLGWVINVIKRSVALMIRRDILVPLVRYNYGDAALGLVPNVILDDIKKGDLEKLAAAIGLLERYGYLEPSQMPATDEMMGLPVRTPEELQRRIKRQNAPPAPVASAGQPGTTPPAADGDDEEAEDA